ncbi:MAG: hypothetical protein OSA44_07895, partial [Nitrospinaceae bacterium]|nr:hypothetical protein [Nitrospinaceae bacterium]
TNFLYRTAHATHQLTQSHKPVHRPPYGQPQIHLFGFNSIKSPEIFLEIDIQQIQHPAFRKHHEFRANSFHQRIIKVSFSNAKKLSFFEYGKKDDLLVFLSIHSRITVINQTTIKIIASAAMGLSNVFSSEKSIFNIVYEK